MCGTQSQTQAAAAQQSAFTSSMISEGSQVFGKDSSVFNAMSNAYSQILAAGPSQQGWSAAQQSAVNSQIINQAAVANRNIASAVGNQQAALGGGNVVLPSGASSALNASIAEQVEAQKSGALTQAQIANYQQGNQNWLAAGRGLQAAPSVFGNMSGFNQAAQTGLNANMANAQAADAASNWWVKPVEGAVGAGLSLATGGMVPANVFTGGGTTGSSGGSPLSGFTNMFSGGGSTPLAVGTPQYMPLTTGAPGSAGGIEGAPQMDLSGNIVGS
jgi:hypothetical protein